MTSPTVDRSEPARHDRRLLLVLERLLGLELGDFSAAMAQAAQQVAEVLVADKVDVFFYAPAEQALIAEGTNDSAMARRQRALGLDHLPLARGGRTVHVFQTGESYRAERAERDPVELPEIIDQLRVRSLLAVPLQIAGTPSGVLVASSSRPAAFT
ncbi:MAG: GAF domain-containing protein, partial [Chloroflexota bacterium]|nr:GAF domain-containing protein [Chloroflexota bacterium]